MSKNIKSLFALLATAAAFSLAHAATIEVEKVSDDELSCAQIAAEVKDMEASVQAGKPEAALAQQRKERLQALAKATKCKLK